MVCKPYRPPVRRFASDDSWWIRRLRSRISWRSRVSRALASLLVLLAAAGLTAAVLAHRHHPFRRGSVRFSGCSVRLVLAECTRVAVPTDPRRPDGPRPAAQPERECDRGQQE